MNRIARIILKNPIKIIAAYVKLSYWANHPEKYTTGQLGDYIQYIMGFVMKSANVQLTVTGTENIPSDGGCMLHGNHQGMFDVIAIAHTCPIPLAIVYKQELKNVPLLKQILKCTRSYALDREDARQGITVMQAVTKNVCEGASYVIFPEGTRSKKGNEMNEWHAGSMRCALKAKCPIVPMAFVDCFKVFDQKGSKPVCAQIHYLEPIPFDEFSSLKTTELAQLVKSRVQAALDRYAQ